MRAKSKRVLIVDPHADVLISLQKLIEDAGFDTETAWTGTDAIRLLLKGKFDIALINEYLPDCDCDVIVRQIQAQISDVGCVVMQSYAPRMDQCNRFKMSGISAVVCKHDGASVLAGITSVTKRELDIQAARKSACSRVGGELCLGPTS